MFVKQWKESNKSSKNKLQNNFLDENIFLFILILEKLNCEPNTMY